MPAFIDISGKVNYLSSLLSQSFEPEWYLCFLCPEFGLFVILVIVIYYIYTRESKMKKKRDEQFSESISQMKLREARMAADMKIREKCVELLKAERGSLMAMVEYTRRISSQVLEEVNKLKDGSVVEFFLSSVIQPHTDTIADWDDIIKIDQSTEVEVIQEIISEIIEEEAHDEMPDEDEKVSEAVERNLLTMPEEVTEEVEIYKEVIKFNRMRLNEVIEEETLLGQSEDVNYSEAERVAP